MTNIFIIEDDKKINKEITSLLNRYGYNCSSSDNYENIVEDAIASNPNLILLDINLPFYDGYYICRKIRKMSDVPIIIVTSRDSEMDEVMSINLGADDFITKPYNTQILLARISAILRRSSSVSTSNLIEYKSVTLNLSKSTVEYEDKEEELSKNEMKILYCLMENKGKIVARDELMDALWQSNEFIDDNTLTVNINRLRRKLDSIGVKEFLHTKRGQGYVVD
ncbi:MULTISPECIES: response regulator transcription factor [Clostridium]|uniref:Stage 0 sporulation protein A homolog n=1 Tax=Clostridium cadaveris TaxID=1529 RepID=A0A1I2KJP6_9CLOT|nr:response regulator transcription factor [Clostridium cadaveris]MDU4953658.1 response regulator transcription factor [Clostridium sp.]MDM8311873.1 response regulator transcription factor [Clostridium cadaveris]MDY4949444.1 response regulator transcription factor [Clostridium cadaveris]NME64527.1 response regulator transcription factor [Clostridium cadaveris]NWK11287.1 response regulator transcription factor [Clostridium cadaveris]